MDNPRVQYFWRGMIGVVLILVGVGLEFFKVWEESWRLALINAGTILLLVNYVYMKRRNLVVRDERSMRVAQAAFSASWFVTFVTLNVMFWLQRSLPEPGMTADWYFGVLFLVMLASAIFFKVWYRNKIDW